MSWGKCSDENFRIVGIYLYVRVLAFVCARACVCARAYEVEKEVKCNKTTTERNKETFRND